MKRILRGVAIAAAIIAPAIMSIAPSAEATTADVFAQTGQGVIAPGLGLTPFPQGFNYYGSGISAGADGVAVLAYCYATGIDVIGTIELGEGNALINCTIDSRTLSVNASFVRAGAAMVVVAAGGILQFGTGVCLFIPPVQTQPVTRYQLECGAAYVQTP